MRRNNDLPLTKGNSAIIEGKCSTDLFADTLPADNEDNPVLIRRIRFSFLQEMAQANRRNPWTAEAYRQFSNFQKLCRCFDELSENETSDSPVKKAIALQELVHLLPRLSALARLDPDTSVEVTEDNWASFRPMRVRSIPVGLLNSKSLSIRQTLF